MAFAENRGDYWRGRYKVAEGKYPAVKDEAEVTIRFRSKREAKQAANEAEVNVRADTYRDPSTGRIAFADYVNAWFERLDLAKSTTQGHERSIEDHLLPAFGELAMADISRAEVDLWLKREKALGYADNSIKLWHKVLHVVLGDAVEDKVIASNPASRRRNRGKRAGRVAHRSEEKSITSALGVLLIAERAALLSGRDDEFVAMVLKGFTGMRWGELVSLERRYVRPGNVRVEWQLYELDGGELHRCPPKDDSRRTIHIPAWLHHLATEHLTRKVSQACPCHDLRYVFSGNKAANRSPQLGTATLKDVAEKAGVSVGTVSNFLNRPEVVEAGTRETVAQAVADLGYVRGAGQRVPAAHWRRNSFAARIFQPAVTGWYPAKAPAKTRPVPTSAEPWPGLPVRGRNAAARAEACWLPIAPGLTPHGLRHTYKTMMEQLGTPKPLMDAQMGHADGSVQARYSHVTQEMIDRLLDGLTKLWTDALNVRADLGPRSVSLSLIDSSGTERRDDDKDRLPDFSPQVSPNPRHRRRPVRDRPPPANTLSG